MTVRGLYSSGGDTLVTCWCSVVSGHSDRKDVLACAPDLLEKIQKQIFDNVSSTAEQKTVGGEEGKEGGEEIPSDELQEGDEQIATLVGSR